MTGEDQKIPKQKIRDAAISLFAQKGYAAVGVREIAKKAGVNISMISYYFDGKVGIMKTIMNEFFENYLEILKIIDDESRSPEECIKILVYNLVNFIKENTELALVAYNTIPLELPEIKKSKVKNLIKSIKMMGRLIARFGLDPDDLIEVGTIGPALISSVFTKFVRLPVIKKVWHLEFDDVLYDRYAETVTTLFLYGITGVYAQKHKK